MFDWEKASTALAEVLRAAVSGRRYDRQYDRTYPGGDEDYISTVPTVFSSPPATFNAPALIVGGTPLEQFHRPSLAVDTVEMTVTVAVGAGQFVELHRLKSLAREAVATDPTLAGTVQVCNPTGTRNGRQINVAGAELSALDVILETRM